MKNILNKRNPSKLAKRPRILTLKFIKRKKLGEFTKNHLKAEVGNIPNMITFSRLFMIPLIIWFQTKGSPRGCYAAAITFVFAGFSDFLDGYLARKMNKISIVGKFLDPLADKLTTLSVMVYLTYFHLLPPWLLLLILSRELAITGLRTIAASEGIVIAASKSGKQKTALQFISITFLLIHYPYYLWGTSFLIDFHRTGLYLLYISLIFSLFSGIEYFALFIEAIEQKARKRKQLVEEVAVDAGFSESEVFSSPDITVVEEHQVELDLDENCDGTE